MKSEKHLLQFPQHNLFCTTIILTIALVITGFGLRPSFASQSTDHFPTIVQTHYGIINGFYNTDSTVAWTGVPFAKPPIGDLRWKAPQDPEHWDGILDATQRVRALHAALHHRTVAASEPYRRRQRGLPLPERLPARQSQNGSFRFTCYIHGGSNTGRHRQCSMTAPGSRPNSGMWWWSSCNIGWDRSGWFTHPAHAPRALRRWTTRAISARWTTSWRCSGFGTEHRRFRRQSAQRH